MIQRIQTLWLALIVILSIAAFFFPLAIFQFPFKDMPIDAVYKILPINTQPFQDIVAWSVMIPNCLVAILSLVTIFMYKNRNLQMKIVAFVFLFTVIEIGLLFFYQIDAGLKYAVTSLCKGTPEIIENTVKAAKTTYGMGSYAPIAQLVCLVFARNGIRKDEIKVRQSERLR